MMRPITMYSKLFAKGDRSDVERSRMILLNLAQAACKTNEIHLLYDSTLPDLYQSGVKYHLEPEGVEEWVDIPCVLERGWGDCDDLAPYRIAELRIRHGIIADPLIRWRQNASGRWVYHMLIIYPVGAIPPDIRKDSPFMKGLSLDKPTQRVIEDPSKNLGMGTPEASMPLEQFEVMIGRAKGLFRVKR
jgi:hypothetical protein